MSSGSSGTQQKKRTNQNGNDCSLLRRSLPDQIESDAITVANKRRAGRCHASRCVKDVAGGWCVTHLNRLWNVLRCASMNRKGTNAHEKTGRLFIFFFFLSPFYFRVFSGIATGTVRLSVWISEGTCSAFFLEAGLLRHCRPELEKHPHSVLYLSFFHAYVYIHLESPANIYQKKRRNWGSIDWLPCAYSRPPNIMDLDFFLFFYFYLSRFYICSRWEMWQSNRKAAIRGCNFEIGAAWILMRATHLERQSHKTVKSYRANKAAATFSSSLFLFMAFFIP